MEKGKKANKNSVQIKAGRYNKTILQSLALLYLTVHTFFTHFLYTYFLHMPSYPFTLHMHFHKHLHIQLHIHFYISLQIDLRAKIELFTDIGAVKVYCLFSYLQLIGNLFTQLIFNN